MIAAQQLSADNDPNGNPQRLWLVYRTLGDRHDRSSAVETVVLDEGYAGRRILLVDMQATEYLSFVELEPIRISKREYHRLEKRAVA